METDLPRAENNTNHSLEIKKKKSITHLWLDEQDENQCFSPCSLATEVERIVRLRLRKVRADSQSIIIFATDDGSFDVT
jgi:hypothetical protein